MRQVPSKSYDLGLLDQVVLPVLRKNQRPKSLKSKLKR